MATSNSRPHLLQTLKPLSLLLAIFITFFLLLLNKVNSSEVLSFSFNKFESKQEDIILQGDALVSSKGELRLTKVEEGKPTGDSIGRALYAAPVHIWDGSTGKVASFVTSFSFVVKAPLLTADGIAFFLAPPDSQIPPSSSRGYLGLFNNSLYNSSNQIVAVEFDTFSNIWDPFFQRHIGIDVNTIESKKTVNWDWRNGEVANVVISYQPATKTLTASLTYPGSKKSTSYILTAAVDLKSVLPEWVSVGFSATTGIWPGFVETHDVLSWSFTSTLETNSSVVKENNAHLASYA